MKRKHSRRLPALLAALSALAMVVLAGSATAVDVNGSLTLPSGFGAPAPDTQEGPSRDYYWEDWNGFLDPRPPAFDPGTALSVALLGEGTVEGEQPSFRLQNGRLSPSTIVVKTGSVLRIRNTDACAYELFAEGNSEFSVVPTSPGSIRQVTVTSAGSWPIRDRVFRHVEGHIHAIDNLVATATIESDGRFHFRGVSPGTYTLKVFHGERELHSQEGVVVAEGREMSLPEAITITAAPSAPAQPEGSESESSGEDQE